MKLSVLFGRLPILAAVFLIVGVSATAQAGALKSQRLGEGPYSRMHMVVKRTFLKIDVARLDIQFGSRTRDRFAAAAKGQSYSKSLADQIARIALSTDNALLRVKFEHNVPYRKWMANVRDTLGASRKAGLIDEADHAEASKLLPRLFSTIESRGFREGDQILWRVGPASLRILLLSSKNTVLLDHIAEGKGPPRMVLAGYFAPGTECREPLIRSLLKR